MTKQRSIPSPRQLLDASALVQCTVLPVCWWNRHDWKRSLEAIAYTVFPMRYSGLKSGRMKGSLLCPGLVPGRPQAMHVVPYSIDPECVIRTQLMDSTALYIATRLKFFSVGIRTRPTRLLDSAQSRRKEAYDHQDVLCDTGCERCIQPSGSGLRRTREHWSIRRYPPLGGETRRRAHSADPSVSYHGEKDLLCGLELFCRRVWGGPYIRRKILTRSVYSGGIPN